MASPSFETEHPAGTDRPDLTADKGRSNSVASNPRERGQSTSSNPTRSKVRMSERSTTYQASRGQMKDHGVPEEYMDALLDDEYMAKLLNATDHLNRKRVKKNTNYRRMNRIIVTCLAVQGLFGVFVALIKSPWLNPSKIFFGVADLDNVDMVLMLDTSGHMYDRRDMQTFVTENLTGTLQDAMGVERDKARTEVQKQVLKAEAEERSKSLLLSMLNFFSWTADTTNNVRVTGGKLRIVTGTFNAMGTAALHDFTQDPTKQASALRDMPASSYASTSTWMDAMEQCTNSVNTGTSPKTKRRYCVLIGDSDAACKKQKDVDVLATCLEWQQDANRDTKNDPCPTDVHDLGVPLEFSHEVDECTNFVVNNDTNFYKADLQLVMVFTVDTDEEEQLRLKNPSFKRFVESTTDCNLMHSTQLVVGLDGIQRVEEQTTLDNETCTRFIMGKTKEDITEKAQKLAQLLEQNKDLKEAPNGETDMRYLWFLLLPLNLVFFIFWSKVVRWWTRVKHKAHKVMGHKKKMVKVTKTLVEKPRRDSMADRFVAQLCEVELGEMKNLRPPIETGCPMSLRARLKGAYMKANLEKGTVDGNGKAFDPLSAWTFEPVEDNGGQVGAVEPGQRMRIRNAKGNIVKIDENGLVSFVPNTKGLKGSELPSDNSTEFIMENAEDEDSQAHLGDTIRIRACGTGQHVRIHKDGHADGTGDASDAETQFVIDRGGQPIACGSVVTLQAAATDDFFHGTHDGHVSAAPGGEDLKFWQIERKAAKTRGSTARPSAIDALARPSIIQKAGSGLGSSLPPVGEDKPALNEGFEEVAGGSLKQGDIITLKGFNQNFLEVDEAGNVFCGKNKMSAMGKTGSGSGGPGGGLGTLREDDEEGGGRSSISGDVGNGPLVQDFVIERVGMTHGNADTTIRRGVQVCLRPVRPDGSAEGGFSDYLQINPQTGGCSADGRCTNGAITLTMDLANVHEMVAPMHQTMQKGDIDLLISPLWNKNDIKKLDAMSSAWTHDEDLGLFKGAVVVANAQGQYTVPKAAGKQQGWVAVVNDGVDLAKAAKQAKSQGATGIIVRCHDALTLDKLSHDKPGAETPSLPAVFVGKEVGEALDERGLMMNGSEFRKKYVTEMMRSIGQHGSKNDASTMKDVFAKVGNAVAQQKKDKDAEPQLAPIPDYSDEYGDDPSTGDDSYRWKVQSNTHYMWSGGGGGATMMKVNYGSAAPPSAIKKHKIDARTGQVITDASKDHRHQDLEKEGMSMRRLFSRRGSRKGSQKLGCAVIDSDALKNHQLSHQLKNVLQEDMVVDVGHEQDTMEQLAEESDFKIEYDFQEIEVEYGKKDEDVQDDEELMDDDLTGAVVGKIGVPLKHFWMVALGLITSTVIIALLLKFLISQPPAQPAFADEFEDDVNAFATPALRSSLRSTVAAVQRLRL